jgi:hypothetical protein
MAECAQRWRASYVLLSPEHPYERASLQKHILLSIKQALLLNA